jgi:DNA-binding transcriptional ArsR family regulator
MARKKTQKKSHVVRDMAQMEAMVSPQRHQIMRTLSAYGVASIKEIAVQLERSPESLYYHFRALEKVGLLIGAGTREVGGRSEALYSTVAKQLLTDAKSTAPKYLDALQRAASALLRLAERQLTAELDFMEETRTVRSVAFRIQQTNARLTPEASAKLSKKIDDAMRFLEENDRPDGEMISVTIASSPIRTSRDPSA